MRSELTGATRPATSQHLVDEAPFAGDRRVSGEPDRE